jgi:hypothetical protein
LTVPQSLFAPDQHLEPLGGLEDTVQVVIRDGLAAANLLRRQHRRRRLGRPGNAAIERPGGPEPENSYGNDNGGTQQRG